MDIIVSREQSGKRFELSPGHQLLLSLPENPTTGYRWVITAENVDLAEEHFNPNTKSTVGGGGERTILVIATRKGIGVVRATLQRSWNEPREVADQCIFYITVL